MQTIEVQQMLREMETGIIFNIIYVTYDRQRKKGGKVITHQEAKLHRAADALAASAEVHQRPLSIAEKTALLQSASTTRSPHHGEHYTRNVVLMQHGHTTSQIRKIHIPLVVKFQGKIVVP